MRATLVVCPLSRLSVTLSESRASRVVTLLRAGERGPDLAAQVPHLRLDLSDLVEPRDGHTLAGPEHLDRLFAFAEAWDRRHPLLVHCFAGVSRSTATAYVLACWLDPQSCEADMADRLRAASPTATPNARIVALADARLGRGGRMSSAVASIGRGAECFEGAPFHLTVLG